MELPLQGCLIILLAWAAPVILSIHCVTSAWSCCPPLQFLWILSWPVTGSLLFLHVIKHSLDWNKWLCSVPAENLAWSVFVCSAFLVANYSENAFFLLKIRFFKVQPLQGQHLYPFKLFGRIFLFLWCCMLQNTSKRGETHPDFL